MEADKQKKFKLYKYLFLSSTLAGFFGLYVAHRFDGAQARTISYILFGVWAVLFVTVRVMIFKDKRVTNTLKEK